MTTLDQFRCTFFQECDDQLASLEAHLVQLAHTGVRTRALNAAFRSVHSIKGGAGMFQFQRLIAFAHTLEGALANLRDKAADITALHVEKLLHANDILSDLIEAERRNHVLPETFEYSAVQDLANILGTPPARTSNAIRWPELPEDAGPQVSGRRWRIRFVPDHNLLRRGLDPLALLRNLAELGPLVARAQIDDLPSLADLDPGRLYCSWMITLNTEAFVDAIREKFGLATLGSIIEIGEDSGGEMAAAASTDGPSASQPDVVNLRLTRGLSSIRVDLERIERLVDLVGEMTIAQSMVLQHLDKSQIDANPSLFRSLGQLQQLTRDLQDSAMAIRAQPVRTLFARMPSVAREVSGANGRKVHVAMLGEDTEVDRTIIERLSDPLIHIVRNAVDHGIEEPEVRLKQGKPEAGHILLTAEQRGGRIIIKVTDDGRGIDREAVFNRAVDRGFLAPGASLSPEDIDALVFLPGLSTASRISDTSGRGVGMDVVQMNIQSLGGRIALHSIPGKGTTTTISLPLTLAILEGMLVKVGDQPFILPLSNVKECVVRPRSAVFVVPGSGEMIAIRDKHIAVADLSQRLGVPSSSHSDKIAVVVVETEIGDVGFLVESVLGIQQFVIKSLRATSRDSQIVSAATILGDGNVAFIIDVNEACIAGHGPAPKVALQPFSTVSCAA